MKELKGIDENTVIHCSTHKEWLKVREITKSNLSDDEDRNMIGNFCYHYGRGYASLTVYKSDGRTIITAAEFIRLNRTPEIPAKWCVRRTPENAEVLNAWAHSKGIELKQDNGYVLYDGDFDYIGPLNYPEITFEQWQTIPEIAEWLREKAFSDNLMDHLGIKLTEKVEEREIIGWKFKEQYNKNEFLAVCRLLCPPTGERKENGWETLFNHGDKSHIKMIESELMHWFEPVYREEPKFKVGDWVVWTRDAKPVARKISAPCSFHSDCWSLSCEQYDSCHKDYLRLASPEEIEAARTKEIWEKYPTWESVPKGGDCFYHAGDWSTDGTFSDIDDFPTKKHANASVAFAMLSQISEAWNEGKQDNWTVRYDIVEQKLVAIHSFYAAQISFASEQLAERSMELHGDLWRKYWLV